MGTGTGSEGLPGRQALQDMPTAGQGVLASFGEVFLHLLEHLIAAQEILSWHPETSASDELHEAEVLCRRVLGILTPGTGGPSAGATGRGR